VSSAAGTPDTKTLIRGGLLLDLGADKHAVRADILIDRDRIAAVRDSISPPDDAKVIEARDRIVIPGLVNAHLHSWEVPFRGRYEDLPLELWGLFAYPFLPMSRLPLRLIRLRTMLVAVESLKNGVTSILDDVLQLGGQELEGLGEVFGGYEEVGLRANVSLRMVDRPWLETIPFAREVLPDDLWKLAQSMSPPAASYYRDICEQAFRDFHRPGGAARFVVAPSAPQRCTPELLRLGADLAAEHETAFHIHLLETRLQAVTARHLYAASPVDYLEGLGVLSDRVTFAHAIWLNNEDIAKIAAYGTSVVHNPVSNLKLGSGVFPYARAHTAGVRLALGTDGISSNDSARMFEVAKLAALLHTVSDPVLERWPSAADILAAATSGGAESLGLYDLGRLKAGDKADIVLLDRRSVAFTPLNDVARQLVYAENGSSVRTVIVGGQTLLDEGRCVRVDEASLIAEANELFASFLTQHAETEQRHAPFLEYFRAIYDRSRSEPI
jgi:5-methylthioadenosine/S-adenosylhomocysteine deaminase